MRMTRISAETHGSSSRGSACNLPVTASSTTQLQTKAATTAFVAAARIRTSRQTHIVPQSKTMSGPLKVKENGNAARVTFGTRMNSISVKSANKPGLLTVEAKFYAISVNEKDKGSLSTRQSEYDGSANDLNHVTCIWKTLRIKCRNKCIIVIIMFYMFSWWYL